MRAGREDIPASAERIIQVSVSLDGDFHILGLCEGFRARHQCSLVRADRGSITVLNEMQ